MLFNCCVSLLLEAEQCWELVFAITGSKVVLRHQYLAKFLFRIMCHVGGNMYFAFSYVYLFLVMLPRQNKEFWYTSICIIIVEFGTALNRYLWVRFSVFRDGTVPRSGVCLSVRRLPLFSFPEFRIGISITRFDCQRSPVQSLSFDHTGTACVWQLI